MALVDRDGLYGMPRFHKAAQAAGVRAIVGVELTIDDCRLTITESESAKFRHRQSSIVNRHWTLPVLVASRTGYQNLCRLLTRMQLRAPKGEGALTLDDLDGHVEGLVALPGQPLLNARQHGVGGLLDRLVGTFGRAGVYVAIARHLDRAQEIDNEIAHRSGRRVSRAHPRHRRRAVRLARRAAAARRLHVPPSQDDAGAGRPAAGGQCRALPAIARGHGGALCRFAAGRHGHARAGRSARVHDGRPGLSLSRIPGAAGRDDGVVSAQDRGGRRARAVSAVSRPRAGAGAAASWI